MNRLFKTRQVGTTYVYYHPQYGNDITGDGSETNPFQTATKSNAVYPTRIAIFWGVSSENIQTIMTIQGDEAWQVMVFSIAISVTVRLSKVRIFSNFAVGNNSSVIDNSVIEASQSICVGPQSVGNVLFNWSRAAGGFTQLLRGVSKNMTLVNPTFTVTSRNSILLGNVYVGLAAQDIFSFSVFSGSSCVFYYKNAGTTPVVKPTWVADPYENMRLLKRAIDPTWGEFGANTELDNYFGTLNINNQKFETCAIIADDGVLSPRIFAEYEADGVTPKSYYLNPNLNNFALFASETGSYVGALPPASPADIGTVINNVDPETGNNVGSGILVYYDQTTLTNNVDPTTYDGQTWNKLRSGILQLPAGQTFKGDNDFAFASGTAYGMYVGKKQTLFGTPLIQSGGTFAVAPDTTYKVKDSSTSDVGVTVTSGVGTNSYSKNVHFKTPTSLTGYTVTANNPNVYLVPVLYAPFESFEVYPYDNLTTPAANLPPFSSPVNSPVLMLYRKATGLPVKHSEIAGNPVDPLFGNFAVTNADWVYGNLVGDVATYEAREVFLTYYVAEVNVNYNKELADE